MANPSLHAVWLNRMDFPDHACLQNCHAGQALGRPTIRNHSLVRLVVGQGCFSMGALALADCSSRESAEITSTTERMPIKAESIDCRLITAAEHLRQG